MSTSPEQHIVGLLSRWLARHVDDADLAHELRSVDVRALTEEERQTVAELQEDLAKANGRGELEVAVRETLEALALGP